MILKASQRAGGMQLACHLLNARDNDHVTVHELRGFVAKELTGAFNEAYAISRGTRCTQFLFSVSLSPPERENVPVEVFEKAISAIETKTGLAGQPRAIVFHEKEGRRHAHCVWSRIDVQKMTAINLPHFKLKLRDISRELYLEQNWQMPRGLMNSKERNPLNFTLAEWQQGKRVECDPRALKEMFRECWAVSDSCAAFSQALEERGFYLARGDRRGHVAVDWRGEVYSLSRWTEVTAKEMTARLGNPETLPSVETTKQRVASLLTDKLKGFQQETDQRYRVQREQLDAARRSLVLTQRLARASLLEQQHVRGNEERTARAAKLPKGIRALWMRLTGTLKRLKQEIETDAAACGLRDGLERQALVEQHLAERRRIRERIKALEGEWKQESEELRTQQPIHSVANTRTEAPLPDTGPTRTRRRMMRR